MAYRGDNEGAEMAGAGMGRRREQMRRRWGRGETMRDWTGTVRNAWKNWPKTTPVSWQFFACPTPSGEFRME